MSSRSSPPWRMFAPLAAVLVLFAAWSAYWLIASTAARAEAERQRAKLASQGITLTCAEERWGGYPFRFEFTCGGAGFTTGQGKGRSGTLRLVAQAYNPWHLIGLIDGPTHFEAASRRFAFSHGRAIVSLNVRDPDRPRLSAEVPELRAEGLFSAGKVTVHARRGEAGRPEGALGAENLEVTVPGKPPLRLDEALVAATLTDAQAADIGTASLRQGGVRLWCKGRLELDPRHRLSGRLAAETNDLDGLLDIVTAYGGLSDKDRTAVKTVFGLLGSAAKADFIFREGEVFWGPFKLGELAPLY